jgi:soluble lytic murein transglycosylase-like protein
MSMTGTSAPVRRRRRARRGRVVVAWITCAVLVLALVGGVVLAVGTARDQGYLGGSIVVPEEYRAVIREAAERCDAVPAEVLAAQIAAESGWDPEAVSPAGARGIAQFMPAVWKQYGIDANADGEASVWDPVDAIHAAAELNCVNRRLVREASGNRLRNTLAAYNAGFATVLRYDGVPPYPETEEYVRKILANAETIVL